MTLVNGYDGSRAIVAAGRAAGLFSKTLHGWEQIDAAPSWALGVRGMRVARGIATSGLRGIACYDHIGVVRYTRLGDFAASGISIGDEAIAVSETGANGIRLLSGDGTLTKFGNFDGSIVGVAWLAGIWYGVISSAEGSHLSALGPQRKIVDGLPPLACAHYADGLWIGLDASAGELLAIDAMEGRIISRRRFAGARALAVDEDFVYAGGPELVAFRRSDWQVAWRAEAPCDDYVLASMPRPLESSLRRGFTNPVRTPEQLQLRILAENGCMLPRTLWPCGHPLPWEAFRANVSAKLPVQLAAGSTHAIETTIVNTSDCYFTSVAPAPIYVSYKWFDPRTNEFADETRARRTALARTILPGATLTMPAEVDAPARAGTFLLRLTLVQEGVTWFDEHDPRAFAQSQITVV